MSTIEDNFLYKAEEATLQILARASGHTEGRNAMLGFCARPDSFYITLDGSDPNDSALWSSHPLPALPMLASAHGVFRDHAQALRWVCDLVGALPYSSKDIGDPVKLLRVESIGPMASEARSFPNIANEQLVWTVDVNLRIVVRTGGKQ